MTPSNPDDDALAFMREQLSDIDVPPDTANVRLLSDLQLAEQLENVKDQLMEIGEMRHVKTQRGRELHSRRSALIVERNKRFS